MLILRSCFLPFIKDEYKKLEVLAFEMEATIASLDERLGMTIEEKDEATSRAEALASELQILSNEFYMSSSELSKLKEEVVILVSHLNYLHVLGSEFAPSSFVANTVKQLPWQYFREQLWRNPSLTVENWSALFRLCLKKKRSC